MRKRKGRRERLVREKEELSVEERKSYGTCEIRETWRKRELEEVGLIVRKEDGN